MGTVVKILSSKKILSSGPREVV